MVKENSILNKEINMKKSLTISVTLIIIVSFIILLIMPKYNQYKSVLSKNDEIRNNILDYRNKINTISDLEGELALLQNEISEKSKILNHNMEDGLFLINLFNFMDKESISLTSLKYQEEINFDGFYGLPIEIEFKGTYENIKKVIKQLQEQKNFTQVLDLNIEALQKETLQKEDSQKVDNIINDLVSAKCMFVIYSKENPKILLDEEYKKLNNGNENPFYTKE